MAISFLGKKETRSSNNFRFFIPLFSSKIANIWIFLPVNRKFYRIFLPFNREYYRLFLPITPLKRNAFPSLQFQWKKRKIRIIQAFV